MLAISSSPLAAHSGLHLSFGVQNVWSLQSSVGKGVLLVCQGGDIPVAVGWTEQARKAGRELGAGSRPQAAWISLCQPTEVVWPKLFKCSSGM